jgi:serine phosphatase RsbU (regulator of sigma subunit)
MFARSCAWRPGSTELGSVKKRVNSPYCRSTRRKFSSFSSFDGALTVLICDVSGHGIGSALMANRIYSEALHQLELKASPGNSLRHLHDFVHDRLATDAFYFTMAAVNFTSRGRRATFAAAGHPPAMLVSNSGVRLLDSQNGILGYLAETAPSESADEIELAPGDRFVLYTDGLAEVFNSCEDLLGVEGLKTLVRQSAKRALPEMRQAILDGVAAWSQEASRRRRFPGYRRSSLIPSSFLQRRAMPER